MSKIEYVNNDKGVVKGEQTIKFLGKQKNLSDEELQILEKESIEILNKCNSNNGGNTTGLVCGYVQSGKTLSFTTALALAKDNGYNLAIILAGTKNNLLTQTSDRLQDGLGRQGFKFLQNPDLQSRNDLSRYLRQRTKPMVVVTLLKRYSRIDAFAELLGELSKNLTLNEFKAIIIDDEADQASLNTLARMNATRGESRESRTFASIMKLRNCINNHHFVQYTATPQGPILIDIMNMLSPDWFHVITPGNNYIGGQVFFGHRRTDLIIEIPEEEVYHGSRNRLLAPPNSLFDAIKRYLIGVAICFHEESISEDVFSMMVHADNGRDDNGLFRDWIEEILSDWRSLYDLDVTETSRLDFENSIWEIYSDDYAINNSFSKNGLLDEIYDIINETKVELVIGGEEEIDWKNDRSFILVGGPKLDRGFTVKNLMVTYMPRQNLGPSNSDTIQQRCRFFGYKKDYLDYCRVYLPLGMIDNYESYLDTEESIRSLIANSDSNTFRRSFILNSGLRPVRNNILGSNAVRTSLGQSFQFNALKFINENEALVQDFLIKNNNFELFRDYESPDRNHWCAKCDINDAIDFLLSFKLTNDRDLDFRNILVQYLLFLIDHNNLIECNVFQMAFERGDDEPRERGLANGNTISNIFSGRSTTGAETYPGDRLIMGAESINIQIHKIKLKSTEHQALHGRIIYTLGIVIPEEFQTRYITQGR